MLALEKAHKENNIADKHLYCGIDLVIKTRYYAHRKKEFSKNLLFF